MRGACPQQMPRLRTHARHYRHEAREGARKVTYMTQPQSQAWPADELVSEISVAARAMGVDEATLAAALSNGQTMAQVARVHGVKERRVVRALVSSVVASAADDIRRGELSTDQVTWLVTLATRRAEKQVTTAFPAMQFGPSAAAAPGEPTGSRRDCRSPAVQPRRPVRQQGRAAFQPARSRSGTGTGPAAGGAPSAGAAPAAAAG
jgi:hypothetical protein